MIYLILYEIIEKLEDKDISLDESFKIYAKGMELLKECNSDIDTIEKSLLNFKNAKRRMETRTIGDTIIIDDYAHHPTEIKVTLEAIRQKYPNKILTVIFRPNTYSRVKDFYREFASSLLVANHIYLTKVSSNRESSLDYPNIESNMIGDLIVGCKYVEEDTINILEPEIGNVVCFMGCADNSKLISGFIDLLK